MQYAYYQCYITICVSLFTIVNKYLFKKYNNWIK